MNIKNLLENEEYIIILDTNVLLNIYRYSPEFSEFGMECLLAIKDYIYLPATVRLEFGKHCRAAFANMEARVKKASKETTDRINKAKENILASCINLERLKFSDVGDFKEGLTAILDNLTKYAFDFFDERKGLELISHYWGKNDKVAELVKYIADDARVMVEPSQEEIFAWCEEGEERYKKGNPPGFKDAKNKDGVRKYGDLIIWKEILKFSRENNKNIIFITDDVKSDWWETNEEKRTFHNSLISEFSKTGHTINAYESQTFYSLLSSEYGIVQSDAVEMALKMTDEDYCSYIEDTVFEHIIDDLAYSGCTYIDEDSAHIGTEGFEEMEITEWSFESAERVSRDDESVTYQFKYNVKTEATSYDYWGRDDDTKEPILSYGTEHEFEGYIIVEVEREANLFIDFEDSKSFEKTHILEGLLIETSYNELLDDADYINYGTYGNCPDCGVALNDENVGSCGFCNKCDVNH